MDQARATRLPPLTHDDGRHRPCGADRRMSMSPSLAVLQNIQPPWLHVTAAPEGSLDEVERELRGLGLTTRVFSADQMRTVDDLFDQFEQRLEFPFFGRNWPALDDCLRDLSWLPAPGYVLLIKHVRYLLDLDPPSQLEVLMRVLVKVATAWSEPISRGEWWDRPPVPFHVILHSAPHELSTFLSRLDTAGVPRSSFDTL
jgi:hypothetical protein